MFIQLIAQKGRAEGPPDYMIQTDDTDDFLGFSHRFYIEPEGCPFLAAAHFIPQNCSLIVQGKEFCRPFWFKFFQELFISDVLINSLFRKRYVRRYKLDELILHRYLPLSVRCYRIIPHSPAVWE